MESGPAFARETVKKCSPMGDDGKDEKEMEELSSISVECWRSSDIFFGRGTTDAGSPASREPEDCGVSTAREGLPFSLGAAELLLSTDELRECFENYFCVSE